MNLWKHVWAHKRNPFYAFCEWYVFGRESNWGEVPAPVKTVPIWKEFDRLNLGPEKTFRCEHMQASGVTSLTCGICGPVPLLVSAAPKIRWRPS
jgi:hypothetical protein